MKVPRLSNPPRLSLCMIVRNEERFLDACLQSVRGIVDEIVIADTGSTDGTMAIAKAFNARTLRVEWQDDFAAARNHCLKHATGDWILQLDADEQLNPESVAELRQWLLRADVLYVSVPIDSPSNNTGTGHVSRAHRLFRNLPGTRYSGRIHEQISPSFAEYRTDEGISNIRLSHLGYREDVVDMTAKLSRNRRLLELEVEEYPGNAFHHFNLAQNMLLSKQYDLAASAIGTALKLGGLPDDIRGCCYNNLADIHSKQRNYSTALDYVLRSLQLNPKQTTAYLLQYEIYEHTGERDKQIAVLEQLLQIIEGNSSEQHRTALQAYVSPGDLYLNLANRYFDSSLYTKAAEAYRKCLELKPDELPVLRALAECYFLLMQYSDALRVYERLLRAAPEDFLIMDRIALIAIKLGMNEKAVQVYEHLLKLAPTNLSVQKRLAALLLKIGDRQRALQILTGETTA